MSPWAWLAVWAGGVALSVLAHEAAHVWAGVRCGWEYRGMYFKPAVLGVGVRLEANGRDSALWKVAAAGPLASAGCAAVFAGLEAVTAGPAATTFHSLMVINLAIVAVNILPFGPLDGGHIKRSLRARRVG